MTPFSQHTALLEQYERMIGGGSATGLSTITFQIQPSPIIAPCTHTEIVGDFVLMAGMSATTTVERCEFRVSALGSYVPRKGDFVTLRVNQNAKPFEMMLWHGGLEPGGEVYRFMLVDKNYKG